MFSSNSSCSQSSISSCRSPCPPSTSGQQPRLTLQGRLVYSAAGRMKCTAGDHQVFRFKHQFHPDQTGQPKNTWLGWPLQHPQQSPLESNRAGIVSEDTRVIPEELWDAQGPAGSCSIRSPYAQHYRVSRVAVPVPVSLPGTEFWQVEMLSDYSKKWPSISFVDGKLQFHKGFLEPVDDPKVVPFFFYRGLEQIRYSWGDRAFQAVFTAVYTGVHLAIFSWFWAQDPSLALAIGINWCLGKLSLGKWAVLLVLAGHDRLWLYFMFLGGKLIDKMMAKLFPPVRRFCWAMFTIWALYVMLSPAYYYPIPFTPFAPGTLGANEALA